MTEQRAAAGGTCSPGPSVDRYGAPVIDPTKNVLDLVDRRDPAPGRPAGAGVQAPAGVSRPEGALRPEAPRGRDSPH